jgi:hypothetical protein
MLWEKKNSRERDQESGCGNQEVRGGLPEEITFDRDLIKLWRYPGRPFHAEGTANAEALRLECTCVLSMWRKQQGGLGSQSSGVGV